MLFFLFLIPAPSQAGLNLGIFTGYYLPSFGKINRQLVRYYNNVYGTNLKLRDDFVSGVQIELEFPTGFKIRVERFSFKAITKDSYTVDSAPYRQEVDYGRKASANPFFMSGIWDVSLEENFSLYLGCGIGVFPTYVRLFRTTKYYSGSTPVSEESWANWQHSDYIGFQYLGGFRYTFKGGLTLSGEMKFLAATATDLDELSTSVNWDGPLFSLTASYRF
ncbi:MAG: hypothetical protein ACE5K3_11605 [bacterium]